MTWRERVEEVFFWACGAALVALALTSETLARVVHAAGVCR